MADHDTVLEVEADMAAHEDDDETEVEPETLEAEAEEVEETELEEAETPVAQVDVENDEEHEDYDEEECWTGSEDDDDDESYVPSFQVLKRIKVANMHIGRSRSRAAATLNPMKPGSNKKKKYGPCWTYEYNTKRCY